MGEIILRCDINGIIQTIQQKHNPMIVASEVSSFTSKALREGEINLYEAYLLNWEIIKLNRKGYTQPGWNSKVSISDCLALLNQKLLSHIFEGISVTENICNLCLEAYGLNDEKRKHYLMDRYTLFLQAQNSPLLLQELQLTRNNYDKLSDDNGPYHNEVFPFDEFSPEKILLDNNFHLYEKTLQDEIVEIIVELNLK